MKLSMELRVRRPVRIFAGGTLMFTLMIALGWTPSAPYEPTATVLRALNRTAIGQVVVGGYVETLSGIFWHIRYDRTW